MYQVVPGVELVLASGSPRRREMLAQVGLDFTLAPAEVDESLLEGEAAPAAARRLARAKAHAAAAAHPVAAVLAADTLVFRDGAILGKPADDQEARSMLAALAGGEHGVVTGYCLLWRGKEEVAAEETRVTFRRPGPRELNAYVASGEPRDKAGAYAIQGLGGALVESIIGSYSNVVGLPLAQVLELLLGAGVIAPLMGDEA